MRTPISSSSRARSRTDEAVQFSFGGFARYPHFAATPRCSATRLPAPDQPVSARFRQRQRVPRNRLPSETSSTRSSAAKAMPVPAAWHDRMRVRWCAPAFGRDGVQFQPLRCGQPRSDAMTVLGIFRACPRPERPPPRRSPALPRGASSRTAHRRSARRRRGIKFASHYRAASTVGFRCELSSTSGWRGGIRSTAGSRTRRRAFHGAKTGQAARFGISHRSPGPIGKRQRAAA